MSLIRVWTLMQTAIHSTTKNSNAELENKAGSAFSERCRSGMWAQALGTAWMWHTQPLAQAWLSQGGVEEPGTLRSGFAFCAMELQPAWLLSVLKYAKMSQLGWNSLTCSVEGPERVHGTKIHQRWPKKGTSLSALGRASCRWEILWENFSLGSSWTLAWPWKVPFLTGHSVTMNKPVLEEGNIEGNREF